MSDNRTVLIDNVTLREQVSQRTGKPFKRTVLAWKGEDGSEKFASAFGDGLFVAAKALEGQKAMITVEEKGNFLDLIAVAPAPKTAQEKMGTGDYVTGQKPPIEVRRMCALNASTNATAMTKDLLSYQTGQEITPELYRAAWDAMYDHCFYRNLRSSKALEDDDIPFG